jgi:hypothetical protein
MVGYMTLRIKCDQERLYFGKIHILAMLDFGAEAPETLSRFVLQFQIHQFSFTLIPDINCPLTRCRPSQDVPDLLCRQQFEDKAIPQPRAPMVRVPKTDTRWMVSNTASSCDS